MKGKYFYLCAALFALNSCTNEINEDGFVDKSNTISFNSYTSKTRAVTEDVTTDNMKGDNFGVTGYTANNNKIYLYKKNNNTDNKGVEQKWNGTSNTWEYKDLGDLKYWPNSTMDFYAYFPYSDNATFAESNASGDVMTIATICAHDVLFAKTSSSKTERVPLTFYHAFSKIKELQIEMPSDGTLFKSNCQVEVETVEFINTSTKGIIKVDNSGTASYTIADPNVTYRKDLTSLPVTINSTVDVNGTPTNNSKALIDNGEKAKGYLFATNSSSAATNNVKGTGKTLWDGDKTSVTNEGGTLSGSGLVCLKLTCKVWNGADDNKYYYVGNDNTYGEIYIPIKAKLDSDITPESADKTALLAGKRYTYIIKMKDNVGFTNAGDPILTPILFEVNKVDAWDDVTVTITL